MAAGVAAGVAVGVGDLGLVAVAALGEAGAEAGAEVAAEAVTAVVEASRGQSNPGMQPPGRPRCCVFEQPLVQGRCRRCDPCPMSVLSRRPHFPASGTAHGWVRGRGPAESGCKDGKAAGGGQWCGRACNIGLRQAAHLQVT